MAPSPFGKPLEELDLEDVRRFFETAGTEPFTWEAKGTELPHPDSIRRHVAGFANQRGGCLVLGARRRGDAWIVDGVEFPSDEPETWTDQILRSRLSPVPELAYRAWEIESGRWVLIVEVGEIAVPPCLDDGRLFQRVAGRTDPVTSQEVVLDLLRRGEQATRSASREAMFLAWDATRDTIGKYGLGKTVAVSVVPAAASAESNSRVFTHSFAVGVHRSLGALTGDPEAYWQVEHAHEGDELHVSVEVVATSEPVRFQAVCTARAGVCVSWTLEEDLGSHDFNERWLGRAWKLAADLSDQLGGLRPAYLSVARRRHEKEVLYDVLGRKELDELVRRLDGSGGRPSQDQLADVERETLRREGNIAWEPEEEAN